MTREEYHQLLYASFVSKAASNSVNSGWSKKIYTVSLDDEMHPVPPAIWKPKPLWTGKQVSISDLLVEYASAVNLK